jgi:hypothetical protein
MGNQNLILLPHAARTASGTQSVPFDVSLMSEMSTFLIVNSASGTSPSLTVTLQDSPDGVNWANLYSFPAVTSGGTVLRAGWSDFKLCLGRYLQATWSITGTSPSFTFSVSVVPTSAE